MWAPICRTKFRGLWMLAIAVALACAAQAQEWTWTSERVDDSGAFNALAIDTEGNVHAGYLSPEGGGTKYAFRSAATGRWFTMIVDKGNGLVNIALDSHQRPHLCYLPYETLKYARWDGTDWQIQEIAPKSGNREFSCGIALGPDDAPHVTWYQVTDVANQLYAHIRHAVLKDGVWRARTLDFGFSTGKWSTVHVDRSGIVHVSYSAFKDGAMRYASADSGDTWTVKTVEDGRTGRRDPTTPGLGNSMVLDRNGKPNFSYRDEITLRYAWPEGDHWRIDVVDPNANPYGNLSWENNRTALALDADGHPHIAYDCDGALKHAWWDGTRWRIQPMGIYGAEHRNASIAISKDNVIYLGYSDPEDRSFRVLIGRPAKPASTPKQTASTK